MRVMYIICKIRSANFCRNNVISCDAGHTYRSDHNFTIHSNSLFLDTVHIEDCRLWVVDDWSTEHGAKDARVADGEVSTVEVGQGQLVITSL